MSGDTTESFIVKVELPDGSKDEHEFARSTTVHTIKEHFAKKHPNIIPKSNEFLFQVLPLINNEVIIVEFIKLASLPSALAHLSNDNTVPLKLLPKKEAQSLEDEQKGLLSRSIEGPKQPRTRRGTIAESKFKSTDSIPLRKRVKSSKEESDKSKYTPKASRSVSLTSALSPRFRSGSVSSSSKKIRQFLSSPMRTSSKDCLNYEDISKPVEPKDPEDWADESESLLIAPNQFAFHTEVGDKILPPHKFISSNFELEVPPQLNLYEIFFLNRDHVNYIGTEEKIGPVIISLIEEKELGATRCLLRTPAETEHLIEYSQGKYTGAPPLKVFLAKSKYEIIRKSVKKIRDNTQLQKDINKFDESHLVRNYKFGVLYCKEGQNTEDEWFGNEHGSPAFDKFLDILGNRIKLEGWDKFRGGLDVRGNTTGEESIFVEWKSNQIMFHVSTLLPFMEADEQKIERKRHIGNDIVVIIFLDGDLMFTPEICKSVFNHIYIVVKEDPIESDCYQVGVTIKDGVKKFGPAFPFPSTIHKSMLQSFLITKMLNAEWAAYKSLDFSHKFKRTRKMQMNAILKDYIPPSQ